MKHLSLPLLCLLWASSAPLLAAEPARPSPAATATRGVMEANSQIMLAERIGKAYAWRGIEPGNRDAQAQHEQASRQFEKQLATLKTVVKTHPDLKSAKPETKAQANELQDNYATLEQVWGNYQKITAAPPTREGGQHLAETAEEVVLYAQRVADALGTSVAPGTRAATLAEAVASLSQRQARLYLLQSWGVKLPFLAKDLEAARARFESLMLQLAVQSANTPSTLSQLDLLKSQWFFFQQAIDELAKNNANPQLQRNVITTSERIFQIAGELAASYQRAVK